MPQALANDWGDISRDRTANPDALEAGEAADLSLLGPQREDNDLVAQRSRLRKVWAFIRFHETSTLVVHVRPLAHSARTTTSLRSRLDERCQSLQDSVKY